MSVHFTQYVRAVCEVHNELIYLVLKNERMIHDQLMSVHFTQYVRAMCEIHNDSVQQYTNSHIQFFKK